MATRGTKRQTDEQKKAKGETRPSRTGPLTLASVFTLPPVTDYPAPPEWVAGHQHAVIEWNRLVPILQAQLVLTEIDITMLGHLVLIHHKLIETYQDSGLPPASYLTALRVYYSEFGMTPASRSRVVTASDGKSQNSFNTNGKKTA